MINKFLLKNFKLKTFKSDINFFQINNRLFTSSSGYKPSSPFHFAFPTHDVNEARKFYGDVLGCSEGRSSEGKWVDFSLGENQIVCHWVGSDYKARDFYNPVDGDEVPVPHFGLCLTVDEFQNLSERVKKAGIKFILEPRLRFKGDPGEQYTMFFKDPSGNNLEFKAMTNTDNLFAKY